MRISRCLHTIYTASLLIPLTTHPAQVINIRSRYTLLALKAKKMGMRVKRLLSQILRPVIDEINKQHKTDYKYSDVEIKLEFNVPTIEAVTLLMPIPRG